MKYSIFTGWSGFILDMLMYLIFLGIAILFYLEIRNHNKINYWDILGFGGFMFVILFMTFQYISTAIILLKTHDMKSQDISFNEVRLNPLNLSYYSFIYSKIDKFQYRKYTLHGEQLKMIINIFNKTIWYWKGNGYKAGNRGPGLRIKILSKNRKYEYNLEYKCSEHEFVIVNWGEVLVPGLKSFLMELGFPDYEIYCHPK